jgi:hypothetical protein
VSAAEHPLTLEWQRRPAVAARREELPTGFAQHRRRRIVGRPIIHPTSAVSLNVPELPQISLAEGANQVCIASSEEEQPQWIAKGQTGEIGRASDLHERSSRFRVRISKRGDNRRRAVQREIQQHEAPRRRGPDGARRLG